MEDGGSLIAEGTAQNHVVLTSVKDRYCGDGSAEPMDWNHLDIAPGASQITLNNLDVLFSTDGIVCGPKGASLEGVVLEKNGLNRVLIDGIELRKTSQGFYQYKNIAKTIVSRREAQVFPEDKKPPSISASKRNYYIAGGIAVAVISGACLYLLMRDKETKAPDPIPDPPPPSWNN